MRLWRSLPPFALRAGFRALTAPRGLRFGASLRRPEVAQDRVLARILRAAAGSAYARQLGLRGDEDYSDFQRRAPIVDYDDLRPFIDAEVATGAPGLCSEAPLLYERTSGSSGRPKLIPYTPSLMRAFNACFVLWAADLMATGPGFRTGRLFFSVSPAFQKRETTPTGVPISLADDAAYLSPTMQRLFADNFFVPGALKQIQDGPTYRRALAAVLVAESRLEVLSVWSPTYLLALLDTIRSERDAIQAHLRRGWTGTEAVRVPLPAVTPARLALLAEDAPAWTELWPELKLLSCWTDGASAAFVPELERALPGVLLQGKGLLATEAPMTVPLIGLGAPAPVPLVDEVFFEFETPGGAVRRLHELRDGETASVVITQPGGLLRYRMHDQVRVEGRAGATPCLRFVGRDDRSSDMVGEKLGEPFVRRVVSQLLGPDGHWSFLMAETTPPSDAGPPGYALVTDHPAGARDPHELAERLDRALEEAFHYRQARRLGQLRAPRVVGRRDARAHYERLLLAKGMRWGDIKFEALLAP